MPSSLLAVECREAVSRSSHSWAPDYALGGTAAAACSTANVFTFDCFDDRTSRDDAKVSKRAMLLGGAVLNAVAVVRRHMIRRADFSRINAFWCGFHAVARAR